LNKNPACKAFIKQPGGVDQYEVEVKYIPGHNPDLVLYDAADQETERIDLTVHKSQEALHGLMEEKGVVRRVAVQTLQSEL